MGRFWCRAQGHAVPGLLCGVVLDGGRANLILSWYCPRCGFGIWRRTTVHMPTTDARLALSVSNKERMEMYLDILHEINDGRARAGLPPLRSIPEEKIRQIIPPGGIEIGAPSALDPQRN
jgi:hypothetical protein